MFVSAVRSRFTVAIPRMQCTNIALGEHCVFRFEHKETITYMIMYVYSISSFPWFLACLDRRTFHMSNARMQQQIRATNTGRALRIHLRNKDNLALILYYHPIAS